MNESLCHTYERWHQYDLVCVCVCVCVWVCVCVYIHTCIYIHQYDPPPLAAAAPGMRRHITKMNQTRQRYKKSRATHTNTPIRRITLLNVSSHSMCCRVLQCGAVCCSMLQYVAVYCSVLRCVALCCSMLQCVAVCCSVLQCVALCCVVLQCVPHTDTYESHLWIYRHTYESIVTYAWGLPHAYISRVLRLFMILHGF